MVLLQKTCYANITASPISLGQLVDYGIPIYHVLIFVTEINKDSPKYINQWHESPKYINQRHEITILWSILSGFYSKQGEYAESTLHVSTGWP